MSTLHTHWYIGTEARENILINARSMQYVKFQCVLSFIFQNWQHSILEKYSWPHVLLLMFVIKNEYHTQLAKMSFDQIFDLTAGMCFIIIIL